MLLVFHLITLFINFQFSSIKHCHGQLVELKKKLMFLHKKTVTLEVSFIVI